MNRREAILAAAAILLGAPLAAEAKIVIGNPNSGKTTSCPLPIHRPPIPYWYVDPTEFRVWQARLVGGYPEK